MHQAVNAVFDSDKHTEVGHVFDLALKLGAYRVTVGNGLPRVVTDLLKPQ